MVARRDPRCLRADGRGSGELAGGAAGPLAAEVLLLLCAAGLGALALLALRRESAAVRRAESRLADAIEAMSDGFVLWDADDRLVLWNGAVEASDFAPLPALEVGIRYEGPAARARRGGRIADAVGREAEYVTERLAQRRAPDQAP